MPIVSQTFVDDAGVPQAGEWVRITLVSRTGWYADGTRKAIRVHTDQTDASGYWERNLPPNSTYEEAGTFYRVERGTDITTIEVPNGAGPYALRSIVRDPVPVDAAWKVTPRLEELLGATALATATDGQVPVWDLASKTWKPITRVTATDLSNGLAGKVNTSTYNDRVSSVDSQLSTLTARVGAVENSNSGKASSSTVSALDSRVTALEPKVTDLQTRVRNIEGGGTGGGAAPKHSGLRGLNTDPDSGAVTDDHPQYLNQTRGDQRYLQPGTADSRYAAISHAARHATGGADAITPAAIGASPSTHVLSDHRAAGQVQPVIYVATADASSSNKAHATLAADVPADTAPTLRSLRQGVVHPIDLDITDVVMGATQDNTIFSFDIIARETCELVMSLTLWVFMSAAGAQNVGTTGEATLGLTCYDVDNGNAVMFSTSAGWWPVHATTATYDYRAGECPSMHVPLGGPYQRGRRYRFIGRGRKTGANANLTAFYLRGYLLEATMVTP